MIYLLDTNVCIHLLNQCQPKVIDHFRQHAPANIALCSVVKAELFYGAQRSQRREPNLETLRTFFAPLASLTFDDAAAEHYGQIRATVFAQGQPIGPNDFLIAAIARANNATLITHSTREFSRIPGLQLEDWEI